MRKRLLVIIALLFLVLAVGALYRYQQYLLAWSAKRGVYSRFRRLHAGVPRTRIVLTLLSDGGTDFYNRVSEIFTGLWMMNLFVSVDVDGLGRVTAVSIGIKDRVAQGRIY